MSASDPLPPAPDHLWVDVPPERPFALDELPAPAADVAGVLARVVTLEMYGAGQAEARAEAALDQEGPLGKELIFHSRIRAETASRALNVYRDLHSQIPPPEREAVLSPDDLQASATDGYRAGLRNERERRTQGSYRGAQVPDFPERLGDRTSLPPVPDNLWPEVALVRPKAMPLAEEGFSVPLDDIAGRLARSVHLEMRGAGECAAKAEAAQGALPLHRAELRFHSRIRAEAAARCLARYQAVHAGLGPLKKLSQPSPTALKAAATVSYQLGVRDGRLFEERARLLHPERGAYNDALYEQLRRRIPGQGSGHRL